VKSATRTALAIGVFLDTNGNERAFLWSEPVELELA
jgi:phage-related protein